MRILTNETPRPVPANGQASHATPSIGDHPASHHLVQSNDSCDEATLEESEARDLQRLAHLLRGRAALEQRICRFLDQGNLTPAETMACLRVIYQAINRIVKGMKPRTSSEEMYHRATAFIKTLNGPQTTPTASPDPRLEGTTPQGREIVRRKLYGLKKKMMERQEARADSATALEPTAA